MSLIKYSYFSFLVVLFVLVITFAFPVWLTLLFAISLLLPVVELSYSDKSSRSKVIKIYGLSLLSGAFFFLGWPMLPLPFFLLVAFVPLLIADRLIDKNLFKRPGTVFFFLSWKSMLIWNASTTWWIWNADAGGAFFAIFLNSLLMTIPLMLYRYTRRVNDNVALGAFISFWLLFEYIHFNWDIAWPWLTLGNGLASVPQLIQWYEFTGVLGGSFLILYMNFMIAKRVRYRSYKRFGVWIWPLVVALVPSLWSFSDYENVDQEGKEVNVVIIQPNIDPYEQKFPGSRMSISYAEQVSYLIEQSKTKTDTETDLILWPETAIQGDHNERDALTDPMISQVRRFVKDMPELRVLTGIESWSVYPDQDKVPVTAKYHESVGYYDRFNSAMFVDSGNVEIYHKSRLVPGVEILPYPFLFKPLVDQLQFQGAGNYGTQPHRTVFWLPDSVGIAPIICYESVFGDFVGDYVQQGATILAIITNDGWWGDTPGHRQHFAYARLRAIETGKTIIRSANTGISGIIEPNGSSRQMIPYQKKGIIKTSVISRKGETFYTANGDLLGRIAMFMSIIFVLSTFVRKRVRKKKNG